MIFTDDYYRAFEDWRIARKKTPLEKVRPIQVELSQGAPCADSDDIDVSSGHNDAHNNMAANPPNPANADDDK